MSNEMILNHLKPLAQRSFYNISHNPDRRGERIIIEYSEELTSDLAEITSWAQTDEQRTSVTETISKYTKKYEQYLSTWLSSQCNCASSFITGGSNFPVARQIKRHNWADSHYNNFRTWRTRALKAIKKFYTIPVDLLELNKQKLADALKLHSFMKLVNSTHKAFLKNQASLETSELPETWKFKIRNYVPKYSWVKHPFEPYELTNNKARIKMYSDRIKVLEAKNTKAVTVGRKEIPWGDGIVILNYEEDRIQIKHNEKPSCEIIENIKLRGFRWSPTNKAWQRKITNNSIYVTSLLTGIKSEKFYK